MCLKLFSESKPRAPSCRCIKFHYLLVSSWQTGGFLAGTVFGIKCSLQAKHEAICNSLNCFLSHKDKVMVWVKQLLQTLKTCFCLQSILPAGGGVLLHSVLLVWELSPAFVLALTVPTALSQGVRTSLLFCRKPFPADYPKFVVENQPRPYYLLYGKQSGNLLSFEGRSHTFEPWQIG